MLDPFTFTFTLESEEFDFLNFILLKDSKNNFKKYFKNYFKRYLDLTQKSKFVQKIGSEKFIILKVTEKSDKYSQKYSKSITANKSIILPAE